MRGGLGIDELVLGAKRAYLLAAMQAVGRQNGRVNISQLSVATGMTRKQVSALLNDADTTTGPVRRSGQQRALRVLRGWLTDPRFQNRRGRPEELRYRSGKKSFALLVRLYGGDVTPKSVLRELERMEIVDVTETGALKLRRSRSRTTVEVHYALSDLAKLFEDIACAAARPNPGPEASSFFGFKDSTVPSAADAAYFMTRFSRRASAFLEDFQQWSVAHKSTRAASGHKRDAIRVGLGVYLLRAAALRSHSTSGGNSPDALRVRSAGKRPR